MDKLQKVKQLNSYVRTPTGWWLVVERGSKSVLHIYKGEELYHSCYCVDSCFKTFSEGWKYNEFEHFYSWIKGHGIRHVDRQFKSFVNERNYKIFLRKLIHYKKADLKRFLSICIVDTKTLLK